MSTSRPQPTRADHKRFVLTEGWQEVASSHHETYEREVSDGRVLRTRISRPPNRTTYGARMWAHILRDQLDVTVDEFWACVQDGVVPDRAPDDAPDRAPDDAPEVVDDAIPIEVVKLLIERVGLTHHGLIDMTRDEAIARLNEYWSTGR